MYQKHLPKILLVLLMAVFCGQVVAAHDFEVNGIYYKKNSDGNTVSVTYSGSSFMEDLYRYENDVTIPSSVAYGGKTYTVTGITADAFQMCFMVTGVTIPNTVNTIGNNAFKGCSNLASFTLPASVTSLGSYVLNGCSSLGSIVVESNNTVYDSRKNCNAIVEKSSNKIMCACNSTVIPATITAIGDKAFETLTLTHIEIPSSVLSIGNNAFNGCQKLDSLILSDQLQSIGSYAFSNCIAMKKLVIGSGVNNIGDYAFYKCSALQSVRSRIADPETVVYADGTSAYTHIFDYVNRVQIPLYVPHGTKHLYTADPHWNDFKNIVEIVEVPGDVNQDGYTNIADATVIYDFLLIGTDYTYYYTLDVDGDGYITIADITAIYDILLGN